MILMCKHISGYDFLYIQLHCYVIYGYLFRDGLFLNFLFYVLTFLLVSGPQSERRNVVAMSQIYWTIKLFTDLITFPIVPVEVNIFMGCICCLMYVVTATEALDLYFIFCFFFGSACVTFFLVLEIKFPVPGNRILVLRGSSPIYCSFLFVLSGNPTLGW